MRLGLKHRQGVLGGRIVNHIGNILFLQMGDNLVPGLGILGQDGILGPGRHAALCHEGSGKILAERGVIPPGHLLAAVNFIVFQCLQLGQQHRRLDGVQPGVHAHTDIVVLAAGALAMDAQRTDDVRRGIVIGEYGTAVAVAAQGLGREERGGGDVAEGAALAALIGRAEGLGCVLDENEAVLLADGCDGVVVAGVTQNIHGHHGLGRELTLSQHSFYLLFQALRAESIGILGNVTKHGGSTEHLSRLRGGDESHVRAEHGVPLPYARHHVGNLQGIGAVGTGNAVLAAHIVRQLLLQLLYLGPADELGGVQHRLDICIDLVLQGRILGFQVNKLHTVHPSFFFSGFAGFPTTVSPAGTFFTITAPNPAKASSSTTH